MLSSSLKGSGLLDTGYGQMQLCRASGDTHTPLGQTKVTGRSRKQLGYFAHFLFGTSYWIEIHFSPWSSRFFSATQFSSLVYFTVKDQPSSHRSHSLPRSARATARLLPTPWTAAFRRKRHSTHTFLREAESPARSLIFVVLFGSLNAQDTCSKSFKQVTRTKMSPSLLPLKFQRVSRSPQ